MPDVLIHGDSMRSPEMRHEVPVSIPDPFLFAEHDGRRVALLTAFEITRVREADPGIEPLSPENFGGTTSSRPASRASRRRSRCTCARAARSASRKRPCPRASRSRSQTICARTA
jgi:hypothetical protein